MVIVIEGMKTVNFPSSGSDGGRRDTGRTAAVSRNTLEERAVGNQIRANSLAYSKRLEELVNQNPDGFFVLSVSKGHEAHALLSEEHRHFNHALSGVVWGKLVDVDGEIRVKVQGGAGAVLTEKKRLGKENEPLFVSIFSAFAITSDDPSGVITELVSGKERLKKLSKEDVICALEEAGL